MCSDLPVLRIDNFKKINKSILNLNELKLEDKDFFNEKLSTSFWIKKMREAETENNKDNSKKYLFTNSYNQIEKIISDYKKKLIYENRVKQFSTILRKLFQKILDIIYS